MDTNKKLRLILRLLRIILEVLEDEANKLERERSDEKVNGDHYYNY